jgi:Coenzyme F420-reducing hydrogenase, delta subunit
MISEAEKAAINFNEINCIQCGRCYSLCPFEAISLDVDTGKFRLDVQKCQVCGICASTCPTSALQITYYNEDSLISYIKEQMEISGNKTLAIMCRGSSLSSNGILDVLEEQNVREFVPLRVPCVGRLSVGFYLHALSIGVNKIIVAQCDEDFCRFKRGSAINVEKSQVLQVLLRTLGYGSDILTIVENPLKAVYDTEKCVGCDKCEFICPYDAIEAQPLATPQINYDLCKGCGACALVCPHLAIQLKGFEYEPSSQAIQKYKIEARKLKARGVSPVILVFCCQWAEFSALDRAKDNFIRENVIIVEIPCFDALDPVHILDALLSDFDGVLAVVCQDEDCKLKEGRGIAEGSILSLERALEKLNLRKRFEVFKTTPRYVDSFDSELDSFISKISLLSSSN